LRRQLLLFGIGVLLDLMLQSFQGFDHIATETESLRNDPQLSGNVGIG
jgi:hypothetical protein